MEFKSGKGKTGCHGQALPTLKLEIEKYLSDYHQDETPFPNPLPEIKLDKLSVVAFVQDDGDKSILHAVSVPVETGSRRDHRRWRSRNHGQDHLRRMRRRRGRPCCRPATMRR